jgi:WD40 repeat protein
MQPPYAVVSREGSISGVSFCADDRRLAIAIADGAIELYDLPTGKQMAQLANLGPIPPPPPSVNQSQIVFGEEFLAIRLSSKIQIRRIRDNRIVATLTHPAAVESFVWHPDGLMLAAACVGQTTAIHLWDAPTGRLLRLLQGQPGLEKHLCFHPQGELLFSLSGWGGTRHLWHPRTGELLVRSIGGNSFWAQFGDSDLLPLEGRFWEVAMGDEYRTLQAADHLDGSTQLISLAIHPGGRLLAVGGTTGAILWDLQTQREVGRVEQGVNVRVAFAGQDLLIQSASGTRRWPIELNPAMALGQVGPPRPNHGSVPGVFDLDCCCDGKVIAWAGYSRGTLLAHADRPNQLLTLPQKDIRSVAVSPDGKYLLAGNWWHGGAKLWDASEAKMLFDWPEPGVHLNVAYSRDGRFVAASDRKCHVWRTGDWQLLYVADGMNPTFSPDGMLLALESGKGSIRLLRAETGAELARLEDPGEARAARMRFSPDGTLLVVLSQDNPGIPVWDLRRLHEQLSGLGLAWEGAAYPPLPTGRTEPLRLKVIAAPDR